MTKTLIFGDAHLETLQQADKAYLLFKKVVQLTKPARVIIDGDLLDFSYISKFSEGLPGAIEGKRIKDDFDILKNELAFYKKYAKEVIFIEGNHEARLNKYLDKNPVLKGMISIEEALNDMNVTYIPTNQQPYAIREDLLVTHGLCYTKYFSCKTVEQCNNNVICAHTHRTQTFTVGYPDGKVITGYGIGTLGPLNPDYCAGLRITGWSHSFAELVEDDDSGKFQVNIIKINDEDNSCIVGNRVIKY